MKQIDIWSKTAFWKTIRRATTVTDEGHTWRLIHRQQREQLIVRNSSLLPCRCCENSSSYSQIYHIHCWTLPHSDRIILCTDKNQIHKLYHNIYNKKQLKSEMNNIIISNHVKHVQETIEREKLWKALFLRRKNWVASQTTKLHFSKRREEK